MRLPGINIGSPQDLKTLLTSTRNASAKGPAVSVFRQSGDTLIQVGELRATRQGELWNASPVNKKITPANVESLGMRIIAPRVNLPNGTIGQLRIGMTVDGTLLVQAEADSIKQPNDEWQILKLALAAAKQKLNIQSADIKAVLLQLT